MYAGKSYKIKVFTWSVELHLANSSSLSGLMNNSPFTFVTRKKSEKHWLVSLALS